MKYIGDSTVKSKSWGSRFCQTARPSRVNQLNMGHGFHSYVKLPEDIWIYCQMLGEHGYTLVNGRLLAMVFGHKYRDKLSSNQLKTSCFGGWDAKRQA